MKAVLVIDVQKALTHDAFNRTNVLNAINRTISHVREQKGLVILIQHTSDSFEPLKKDAKGWQLDEALDVQDQDIRIEKAASDSFYDSDLIDVLQKNGVDHVYITGLQSEYCVDATARSALSKNYQVTLVSDAHTTMESHMSAEAAIEHHNVVLGNLAHPVRKIQVLNSGEL